ncbi:hypothetical protein EXIGLDRAFT_65304 [Exidia glandulosa HHB12029]|uniref:Uncharacterized protein n=1 Tax=Exidia glandulosa HHB12029 TaxID=1314781 RepID=A0A165P2D0_EXIGL|nr:hypothetical protein EXIGLDRAFT_65304 [Exidia glandulosa HHB12029]
MSCEGCSRRWRHHRPASAANSPRTSLINHAVPCARLLRSFIPLAVVFVCISSSPTHPTHLIPIVLHPPSRQILVAPTLLPSPPPPSPILSCRVNSKLAARI